MKLKILFILLLYSIYSFTQETYFPTILGESFCPIEYVSISDNKTIIKLKYIETENNSWVSFSKKTFLQDVASGKTYAIINVLTSRKNILEFDKHYQTKGYITYYFYLVFQKIPSGVEEINIIENIEDGFKWLNVIINNPDNNIKSTGTGFALSSSGYIITNHHVVENANSIKVRGLNGDFSKTYNAKIVADDKNNDLTIIQIDDESFTTLGTIPYMFRNKTSDVGSNIFVLGYPLIATMGDEVKLTNGIISSKTGFQGDITSYQISAPVQPGNSGGPLFNSKGYVIGVVNAKYNGAENASYAIKINYLTNLIDLLPNSVKLPTVSKVYGKSLSEQVKIIKNYTYIIEIN